MAGRNQTEAHKRGRRVVEAKARWLERLHEARKLVARDEAGEIATQPRPAWMDDPSLLPKRPPGAAQP